MKKNILTTVSVILLLFIYISNNVSSAFGLQPGSAEDPLISKSYLEERLSSLEMNNEPTLSYETLNFIIQDVTSRVLLEISYNAQGNYEPVYVATGQRLIGYEGTEIILRSGSALVFTTVEDGLVNITTGEELLSGDRVELNNKLIVPRNDGRGMLVTEDSWFIIRGEYSIND